jgi:phosphopantothenate synthetase
MLKWISKIFPLSPTSVREENNIVQSIAKAKTLHRELISKAHPDKNPSKEELAKVLTEEINNNRYNYRELLKLKQRIETEL